MRRVLILLLALAIAGSATAAPAASCVPTHATVAATPHSCCETAIAAPAASCCVVSVPAQRLSTTEGRLAAPDQVAAVPRSGRHDAWSTPGRSTGVPPPLLLRSRVPLYLQQLSLLI